MPHLVERPEALRRGVAALGLALALALATDAPAAAAAADWSVIGRQGLVRYVLVPAAAVADAAAYRVQIERLCEPERTCFLNFYANPAGAPLAVPLPDAIEREATATFRRSSKNGVERFQWRCRLQPVAADCF
ncbi:hypothetical protein ABXN37_08050 [Piscinibacter sakaiensis]|uniref:hypothetical protein n=1 Tax=Piscinibacter sakaiensis TaxID=1547922 RepID=UPI0037291B90